MENRNLILGLCLFGLLIRVIYTIFFNPEIFFPDEEKFWKTGISVANDLTIKVSGKYAHDMPITALLIGGIIKVFGTSELWVKLVFTIISSVTIYLIAALSYEIYPNRYVGVMAAAVSSCYPFFIFYSSLVQSETIFVFFVTLLFLQLLKNAPVSPILAGITAGFAHLTRPTMWYFLPVLWGWQYLVQKQTAKFLMLTILTFSITILPWGIRNITALGEFHLTTTGSGQVLWEGNNPWNMEGGVSGSFSDPDAYLAIIPEDISELNQDRLKKKNAIDFVMSDPMRFLSLSIKKLIRFWNVTPNSVDYQSKLYKLLSLFSFGLVLLLAIPAMYVLRNQAMRLSIIYLFFIYYTLLHMVTIGSVRYRLPLEPLLIGLACAGIGKVLNDMAIGTSR